MKFVDEATIMVCAGNGGDGCSSLLREKFRPFGGPDGGDGGDGGSVYLQASANVNTLVDFRHQRHFQVQSGAKGGNRDRSGKQGEDLTITVPIGTLVSDAQTQEFIGELLQDGDRLLVAKGGIHGLGNARFKSSVNRAPRRFTCGTPGDVRELALELKLLADVGLIGQPNAGKSTLIRAVSAATPKVADYPFTTLHPHLGVVRVSSYRSFVMADIPGLIAGAAEGAGLGMQFLKHIQRTRLLLQVVDVCPADETDPVEAILAVRQELARFDPNLLQKPCWLVLNKIDLLDAPHLEQLRTRIVNALAWQGPVYLISAIKNEGCAPLMQDIMITLESARVGIEAKSH